MNENKEKRDAWEAYGEYFKKRTVRDIIEEYHEQHDEWKSCGFDESDKEGDNSWK